MACIRTVLGDIPPEALGATYPHEHLLTRPPPSAPDPDFLMDSEDAALRELTFFRAAGGGAIVEMSPQDYGRQPEGLRRLSEATGVHIIAVSGRIKEKFSGPLVTERTADEIADELVRDVEEGIGASGVRAGVLKAGSSLDRITPGEERALRGAARAQRATGAAISTHTEAGTMGLEQVALLRAEGVPPEKIVIGHLDRRMDWGYHLALLKAGVTIQYDQVGKEKYGSDTERAAFVVRAFREGYGERIMVSGDMARRSSWPSYGGWGGPGLTHILWRFVPLLRQAGLSTDAIEQLIVRTPARVFRIER